MKQFGKLFRNLRIILLLTFLVDRGIGYLVKIYFEKELQGDSAKTTYALKKVKEDVLIFGSSRAAHHYQSKILHDSLGLTCFNAGRDGMKIPYARALLQVILSYHTPKIVILDIGPGDFTYTARKKRNVAIFLPYLDNKIVADYVFKEDPAEGVKAKISMLYRYNSLPLSIVQHHLGVGQKHINGYEPLYGCKVEGTTPEIIYNTDYIESQQVISDFESIVKMVCEKKIKLFVFISPDMQKPVNTCKATVKQILNKYNLPLYDYSESIPPDQRSFFYDNEHLNDQGAIAFTNMILKDVISRSVRPGSLALTDSR